MSGSNHNKQAVGQVGFEVRGVIECRASKDFGVRLLCVGCLRLAFSVWGPIRSEVLWHPDMSLQAGTVKLYSN